jgi:hypothetical protein
MPRVGFELTIPVFERAKTVYALNRAATVIGHFPLQGPNVLVSMKKILRKYICINDDLVNGL